MIEGSGQPVIYKVVVSQRLRTAVREVHAQAAARGRGYEFLDAIRTITKRLQSDPREFGEPLYRLPALGLMVYHVFVSRVAVHFAVHDEKPLVWIRSVKFLD